MTSRDYAYYRDVVHGRRLPLAYVDLDLFDRNAAAIAQRAGGLPVRVASKSIRCRELLARTLKNDAYAGVMCFTAAEAAFLSRHGFDDLLIAYPTVDAQELGDACARVGEGARITFMVDDPRHVQVLSEIADRRQLELSTCIDVDVSMRLPGLHFGVRRSPIHDADAALRLAELIDATRRLRLRGIMAYEAQIAGVRDAAPGQMWMNTAVRALKRLSERDVSRRRFEVVDALRGRDLEIELVNGGGTGSLETSRRDRILTELTAGSGLLCPALFDGYRAFSHLPAAGFALPVTRRPAPGLYTCHGGGYVASGSSGPDKLPVPHLPPGGQLLPMEGAGEVQTPIAYSGASDLAIGDPVFMRHAKAGELCERFDTLLLIADGEIVDEVPTYRGDGHAFL